MAKISARGASKVAQANKEWTDSDGYDHKIRLALRSDGKVLRAHDLRTASMRDSYGSRGWNRGGYSIIGSLASTGSSSALERFKRYAEQRGHTIQ